MERTAKRRKRREIAEPRHAADGLWPRLHAGVRRTEEASARDAYRLSELSTTARDRQARSFNRRRWLVPGRPSGLTMYLTTLTLVLVLLRAPLTADAQQGGKVYRIGYLRYLACAEPAFFTDLRQGLRELGYAEGHNLVIECRAAPGKAEKIPDHAADLVHLNVDVIVAEGTISALAAKQATRTVPIVMVNIGDPVASGLVSSLGRPGGNVTGSTMLAQAPDGRLFSC